MFSRKRKRNAEIADREVACSNELHELLGILAKKYDCDIFPAIRPQPDGTYEPMIIVKARDGGLRSE